MDGFFQIKLSRTTRPYDINIFWHGHLEPTYPTPRPILGQAEVRLGRRNPKGTMFESFLVPLQNVLFFDRVGSRHIHTFLLIRYDPTIEKLLFWVFRALWLRNAKAEISSTTTVRSSISAQHFCAWIGHDNMVTLWWIWELNLVKKVIFEKFHDVGTVSFGCASLYRDDTKVEIHLCIMWLPHCSTKNFYGQDALVHMVAPIIFWIIINRYFMRYKSWFQQGMKIRFIEIIPDTGLHESEILQIERMYHLMMSTNLPRRELAYVWVVRTKEKTISQKNKRNQKNKRTPKKKFGFNTTLFPGGPPPQYWAGSNRVNFGVRMRTGALRLIWSNPYFPESRFSNNSCKHFESIFCCIQL